MNHERRNTPVTILSVALWLACGSSVLQGQAPPLATAKKKNDPAKEAPLPEVDGIAWTESFDAALASAKEANKPVLVDFGAEWCGFCKKLDRETFGDANVIQFVRQYLIAVKVDGDRSRKLRQRFSVEGYPTILFLNSDGAELKRIKGFRSAGAFLSDATAAVRSSNTLEKLKAAAEQAPHDTSAQRAYARALNAVGNSSKALAVLRLALARESSPELQLDLGDLLARAGKHREAADAYKQALPKAATPGDTSGGLHTQDAERAYLALARTLIRLKEYKGSLDRLSTLIGRQPEGVVLFEALFLRGYAYASLKDASRAIEDLKTAEKADPDGYWGLQATLILELVDSGVANE